MLTVKQLIKQLQGVEEKSLPVYLETEDSDTFYIPTAAIELRDFVVLCTCFEEVKT